jgi:hypothetical protein
MCYARLKKEIDSNHELLSPKGQIHRERTTTQVHRRMEQDSQTHIDSLHKKAKNKNQEHHEGQEQEPERPGRPQTGSTQFAAPPQGPARLTPRSLLPPSTPARVAASAPTCGRVSGFDTTGK